MQRRLVKKALISVGAPCRLLTLTHSLRLDLLYIIERLKYIRMDFYSILVSSLCLSPLRNGYHLTRRWNAAQKCQPFLRHPMASATRPDDTTKYIACDVHSRAE